MNAQAKAIEKGPSRPVRPDFFSSSCAWCPRLVFPPSLLSLEAGAEAMEHLGFPATGVLRKGKASPVDPEHRGSSPLHLLMRGCGANCSRPKLFLHSGIASLWHLEAGQPGALGCREAKGQLDVLGPSVPGRCPHSKGTTWPLNPVSVPVPTVHPNSQSSQCPNDHIQTSPRASSARASEPLLTPRAAQVPARYHLLRSTPCGYSGSVPGPPLRDTCLPPTPAWGAPTQLPVPHGNSRRHSFRRCSCTAVLKVPVFLSLALESLVAMLPEAGSSLGNRQTRYPGCREQVEASLSQLSKPPAKRLPGRLRAPYNSRWWAPLRAILSLLPKIARPHSAGQKRQH